jgi:hypothetical protein
MGLPAPPFGSEKVLFNDAKWSCVEAMFKLNSLDMATDKPNHDGELRGWVDGKLVEFRSTVGRSGSVRLYVREEDPGEQ